MLADGLRDARRVGHRDVIVRGSRFMFGLDTFGRSVALAVATVLGVSVGAGAAERETLKFYVDGDFTNTTVSTGAVLSGIEAALDGIGHEIAGHPIEVVPKDHRSSPKRSAHTMRHFNSDPAAVAVFGGMQSPPYLTYGDYINDNGIPLLLSWSAAAPVTRMGEGDRNYIFRLSVDDSKAGGFLIRTAIANGCRSIAVLMTDTGWGRANYKTISAAAKEIGFELALMEMIDPDLGPITAEGIARTVEASKAECAITVVTSGSGKELIPALHGAIDNLRVFSHWGILGGEFVSSVSHSVREALKLQVLQTCGLEVERAGSPILKRVLAKHADPIIAEEGLSGMQAPAGFVHAHDLTLVLAAAIRQAAETPEWAQGSKARRTAIKQALETLEAPVPGILRTYTRPFSTMTADTYDAHEALGVNDLCMATFKQDGKLVAVPRSALGG